MSIKIKVSYERPDELKQVLCLLKPVIRKVQQDKKQTGKYQRAYLLIDSEKDQ